MVEVHQLLHGYRSGHGQIAGSVKLAERDSELVTRLSDLSGSLSSGIHFTSYLTVYPLPSRTFFAVARTWPDREAPRTGCVVTHTLLVPMKLWSQLPDVRSLNALFRNPRADLKYSFTEPVALPSTIDSLAQSETRINLAGAKKFVYFYFGQAMRPMIWFDADSPEEYLWRLLEHLWPRLRGVFSCCTFSLQQRALEEGPFDLLFAPSSISARFLKLSSEHLIKGDGTSNEPQLTEPWCQYWAEALFSASRGLPSGEDDLPVWKELSEDPTTLRKLSLIQELSNRAVHSPTAGVGAIDVVESLANDPESALPLKRQVLGSAIEAAAAASPAKDGLTSLRLIDDRLRRESFKQIAKTFEGPLSAAAARVTVANPEAAIEADGTWLADSRAGTDSAFVNGVVLGLREVANTTPARLSVLRTRPDIAVEIFRLEPTFAATYLQVGGEAAPGVLANWLSTTRDTDTLRRVRKSVLPLLHRADDEVLLSPLLRDLLESEVKVTLDTLSEISDGFSDVGVRRITAEQVSSVYPVEVREWASEVRRWSAGISSLVAATYAPTRHGFDELLGDDRLAGERQAGVLAAMVNSQKPGVPYWLREFVSKDVRIISALLLEGDGGVESTDSALATILNEVPDLPIAQSAALLEKLLAVEERPYSSQLFRAAVKSVIACYVSEGFDTPATPLFMNSPAAARCLQSVSGFDLIDWFVQNCSSAVATARAWDWISRAPTSLYHRYPAVLPDLCDALLRYSRYTFPQGAQHSLLQILRRARSESDADVRQSLATKSLRFAFDNVNFPLGSVVAEAFPDVYAVAIQENRSPSFFSFFGSYDWDKGKDLRVAVIDAFLRSNWPPGELALAASNAGILRKIFKRLHKKSRGDDYIKAMLDNLASWNDPSVSWLREELQALATSPNFYEEWD